MSIKLILYYLYYYQYLYLYYLAKIIIAVSCFSKRSIVDIWQGSENASGSEYQKVLNMSLVLDVPEFWIYQGSEYARVTQGLEYA